ncbi:MAG: protease Do, partial [Methylophilaceae bacterium]
MTVQAKELPDFTELAEKQGPTVVNISVTQVMSGNGQGSFPGMPNDEALNELFRRFGLPTPGMPGGP